MKQITTISITAPGFYGLNRQDSSVDLPVGFAQTAENCVIDRYGRLGSRKGSTRANSVSAALSTADVAAIHELVMNDGSIYVICAGNNKLFTFAGGVLTEITYGGGGAAPTITASNWQFVSLNGIAYMFQRGYDPMIYDPTVSTTTYRRVTEKTGYVAAATPALIQSNTAISAFGRIWCADTSTDKQTVSFSDLLTGYIWNTGTSGYLEVDKVWPNGVDEIVALAAHNNFLVIFGKKQILIYSGATTPSTMTLYDTIESIGCYARDTVQSTGTDLIFLSGTGLRSLARTIQEKSAPLNNLSKNIHDHLVSDVLSETADNIKSIYSDVNSFYLLTLPTSQETYCFDTRSALEDGALRVTTWSIRPTAYCVSRDKTLYMGSAGYLNTYSGYLDETATYVMEWYSTHMTLGEPNRASIIKKLGIVAVGGSGQIVTMYYGFDFTTSYNSSLLTLSSGATSEYGIAEYGIGEYSASSALNNKGANVGGAGKVVQIGLSATINDAQLSFQKIDLFAKVGKTIM